MADDLKDFIRAQNQQIRADTAAALSTLSEQVTELRVELKGVTTKMSDITRLEQELRDERTARVSSDERIRKLENWMHQQGGAEGARGRYQNIWDSLWVRIIGVLAAAAVIAVLTAVLVSWSGARENQALLDRILELEAASAPEAGG